MAVLFADMSTERLIGARDALSDLGDEIYTILIDPRNQGTVRLAVQKHMSQRLAEAQAELIRHRRNNA